MITLNVLTCKNEDCSFDIVLPLPFVREVFSHSKLSRAGNEILNVVCQHCGSGYPYSPAEIRKKESSFDPYTLAGGRSLFHESLKCGAVGCSTLARVHTIVTRSGKTAAPTKPLTQWHIHDITCCDGHLIAEPPQVVAKLQRRAV